MSIEDIMNKKKETTVRNGLELKRGRKGVRLSSRNGNKRNKANGNESNQREKGRKK